MKRAPVTREAAAALLQHDLPAAQGGRALSPVIDEARRLERLITKRRRLRRDLRTVDADIRHSRKMLAALAGANGGVAPTRKGAKS